MSYLEETFLRIVAMQKECINTANGAPYNADAVPYFFYWQEDFPYWANRLQPGTPDEYYTEDYTRETYTIIMRYVVGHLTQGQVGSVESLLWVDIPIIQAYFRARIGLTSATYTAFMDKLDAQNTTFNGLVREGVFHDAGIEPLQIACEFSITVPIVIPITYTRWR